MNKHFPIVELAVKRSRSAQGHHLNNLGSARVPMLIPSNKIIGQLVLEKKIFKGLSMYGTWPQCQSCDPTHS